MVHRPSFLCHFFHALYDFDANKAVGKGKSEEYALSFQILFLVLNRFPALLFSPLMFPLQVALCHQLVVFNFEVGRANVFSGCLCPCRNDAGGLWCHATLSRPQ